MEMQASNGRVVTSYRSVFVNNRARTGSRGTTTDATEHWSTLEDAGVTVLNPPPVARWNVRKLYLRDFADAIETALGVG